MADFDGLLRQAAYPDQVMPEARDDVIAGAVPTDNPFAVQPSPSLPSTSQIPATVADKKAQVAMATDQKRMAMGEAPSGYQMAAGRLTGQKGWHPTEIESDLRNLSLSQLRGKYGNQTDQLLAQASSAANEVTRDMNAPDRSTFEWAADNTKEIGGGLVSSIGGILNWGVGAVSDRAGVKGAELLQSFNNAIQDNASDELKADRRIQEAKNFLDFRDNTVQEAAEIEGGSTPLSAALNRIGRDAIDSVKNAGMSGTTLQAGTAQAVGSLLAAGPVAKAIKAAAGAVIPANTARAAVLASETASPLVRGAVDVAVKAGEKAPILTAIGAMEGGGSYQQSVNEVMGRSHDQLMQESPMYREMVAADPDNKELQQEAKEAVANRNGLLAAAITAPLAAATGTLVSRFEGAPLARASGRAAAGNIVRETGEETIQGATGQLAQNYAERQTANENASMSEGVGRQVGEGALYGAGMSVLVQAPNLARAAGTQAAAAVGLGAAAVMDVVNEKAAAVRAGNENTGPASRDVILEAAPAAMSYADELQANMMGKLQERFAESESVPQEEVEAVQSFADSFRQTLIFNQDDVRQSTLESLGDVKSRPEAAFKLMDMFDAEKDTTKKADLALDIVSLLSNVNSFVQGNQQAIAENYASDPQVKKYIDALGNMEELLYSNPQRARAIDEATAIFEGRGPEGNAIDVVDQQSANDAVAIATTAPAAANLDTNNAVLQMASKGTIQLSPAQRTAIQFSNALLQAAKTASDEAVKLGDTTEATKVSRNITTEKGAKGESALEYAQSIMSAYKGGELDIAAARLGYLFNFAQSLQNKVAALNAHFERGNPTGPNVIYQTVANGGRDVPAGQNPWFDSKKGAFVQPAQANSVKNAQATHLDARLLADVYNGLVDAFPDLNAQHIQPISLASELLSPVDSVTEKYRSSNSGNSRGEQNAITPTEETTQVQTADVASVPAVETVAPTNDTGVSTETVPEPVEAQTTAEPVVEENSEVEPVTSTESAPAEESEPSAKGMDAVYPNLLTVGNRPSNFKQAFSLAKKQISRLTGSENPIQIVTDALKDSAALTAVMGKEPRHKLKPAIAKAYKGIFAQAENTIDIATEAMNKYLDRKYSKGSNVTRRDLILSGETVKRQDGSDLSGDFFLKTFEGRALNITEVVDGQLVFNRELIESAALAAQQYVLTLDDFIRTLDAKDVSQITTIPEDMVTPELIEEMSQGLYRTNLQDGLAQKIQQYWGLSNNPDGLIGEQQGIVDAVAAQFMAALVQTGQIVPTRIELTEANGLPAKEDGSPNKQEFILFNTVGLGKDNPLNGYPTAIDDAVLVEPEQDYYVGAGATVPVAQFQMRNRLVENTPDQKKAIEFEQQTEHKLSWMMGGFYKALGLDNHLKLFGAGDMDRQVWNVNHKKSLEGRNRGITAAYDQMMVMMDMVQNVGENQGIPYWQVPIRYAHNMSRVGRLQMLGKQNPQSNKQMRALISPTYSTLDMSSETNLDFARFMRGIGQHLGVKVHKEMPDVMYGKVMRLLDKLKPSIDALANWQLGVDPKTAMNPREGISDETVDLLMENFKEAGADLTPDALLSLMDYARYRENPDSRAAFETSVYLEADGVTNGPINAMNLFTRGTFTTPWVRNVAKGGLYFNKPGQTLNQHIADGDTNDLYSEAKDGANEEITKLRDKLINSNPDKRAVQQLNHLLTAMDLFFGKDLSFDQDSGVLTLERGIAKNPLTITIYGSSARGIAAKLTSTMTDAIYERLSQASQRQAQDKNLSLAQAMFDGLDAQAKYDRFTDSMSKLMGQGVFEKDGLYKVTGTAGSRNFIQNPETFTFKADAIKNIQENMLAFFVGPMTKSIEQTVGKPLLDTANLVRTGVQIQSLILEDVFKQEVQKVLDKKRDSYYSPNDLMTRKELEAIYKKLEALSPFIDTGAQRFYVAGSTVNPVGGSLGSTFSGEYRSKARIDGPGDAGVAGVPYMNIGTGDGYMMQLIANMEGALQNTLKVFDGQNLPLDRIEDGSRMANQAVWQTWQANPMKAIHESFSGVTSAVDLSALTPEAKNKIGYAIFKKEGLDLTDEQLKNALDSMADNMDRTQLSIEARHRAMARMHISVDQMAGAMSPYQHEAPVIEGLNSPEEIAVQLDLFYREELAKLMDNPEKKAVSLGSAIDEAATLHESGVRILRPLDLKNLAKLIDLPGEQNTVFNQIVNGLSLKGYTVVYGDAAQQAEYAKVSGRRDPGLNQNQTDEQVHGYTVIADKTVYLIDPSTETMVHELVHAATFDTVALHYSDRAFAKANPQGAAAIKRIEKLMDQFLAMKDELSGSLNLDLQAAYDNAHAAITQYTGNADPVAKASALNEFMAWGLSNQKLTGLLKQTTASKLAQIAKDVLAAIKSMFSRTRLLEDPKQDMFSNLLFNSSMLMYNQPRLARRLANTTLYQSARYGNDDRLTAVAEAFDQSVGRFMRDDLSLGGSTSDNQTKIGIINASKVADLFLAQGFNMNMQQASTFKKIVAALATEAAIDPNAMAMAQQLYAHVLQNVKPEMFIDPTDSDAQRAESIANQKYNVLMGNYGTQTDLKGRTSLLPAFIALATVDTGFREILSKIDKPKSIKNTEGTLDAGLENLGNRMMDSLGSRMAGLTNASPDVLSAMDELNNQVMKTVQDQENFIGSALNQGQTLVDRANTILVDGISYLSGKAYDWGKSFAENSDNRYMKLAGNVVAASTLLVNEEKAGIIAEGLLSTTNRSQLPEAVRKFMAELVGRTASNANVYDMIKATKAMVQKVRQQFREDLPTLIDSKFTRKLSDAEWTSLFRSLGRTDIAALEETFSQDQIIDMLKDGRVMDREISQMENSLRQFDPANFRLTQQKMQQLAEFMMTGRPGTKLLRNAEAIAQLLGETKKAPFQTKGAAEIRMIDQLTSLYAIKSLSQEDKDTFVSLAQTEGQGLKFTMSYMVGQRAEEIRKSASPMARLNGYKGYIPMQSIEGTSLIVADNAERARLLSMSYVAVEDYEGSSADPYTRAGQKSYFFAPVSARAPFEQGIMQNVRQSAAGVDATTGHSLVPTAGTITEAAVIKKMLANLGRETGREPLMPVYNEAGTVVALERSLDPTIATKAAGEGHLGKVLGIWRGRQEEEAQAQIFNEALVDQLKKMYDKSVRDKGKLGEDEYVDLFSAADPVYADAIKLMNRETREYVGKVFGNKFMVRKDMIDDAVGYRSATVGDAWTGNTRWNQKTQDTVKNLAIAAFGNQAYQKFVNGEKILQNVVSDAKVLIVVKSVVVPIANLMSNVYQLVGRGVPLTSIARGMPKKTAELNAYIKGEYRMKELEAELRASVNNPNATLKFEAERQSIQDGFKRMSIWPLIEAGEFSSVSDVGISREDILLSEGRLQGYIESLVNKLPPALATAGKYGLVTKDTALFQGLQKAVEYGDFLGKAIYFDELTKRKGMTQKEALGRITEEFVNYDRLSGRFRGYLEDMGLLWFYNFKIRIMKVALSMIRNNPVHTLLATMAPAPEMFGSVGLPTTDSLINKALNGSLEYSIGPGQGLSAFALNPWVNLAH
jgi:hypothetical protein